MASPFRPQAASQAPVRKPICRCQPCGQDFYHADGYDRHLINSPRHFPCRDCMADHHTAEALKRHRDQMHATEQKMKCPGCHKEFNRLGGLMGHMELDGCLFIPTGYVATLRAEDPHNSNMFERIREAAANGDLEPAGLQVADSHPASTTSDSWSEMGAQKTVSAEKDGDLISFDQDDLASVVWDSPWDESTPAGPVFDKELDFPALAPVSNNVVKIPTGAAVSSTKPQIPGNPVDPVSSPYNHHSVTHIPSELATSPTRVNAISTQNSSTPVPPVPAWEAVRPAIRPRVPADTVGFQTATTSAWNNSASVATATAVLLTSAVPAVAPPAALLESLTIAATIKSVYEEHHPDNADFNVQRYYSAFGKGYKCPYGKEKPCKKYLKTASALIQHLRSPTHNDGLEEQTCYQCHRPFPNTTALTQHVESQAICCDARKTGNVSTKIEGITQFATVGGQHEDDTNKYDLRSDRTINPAEVVRNVVEKSRRAAEAHAKAQDEFWTKDKLKDHKW